MAIQFPSVIFIAIYRGQRLPPFPALHRARAEMSFSLRLVQILQSISQCVSKACNFCHTGTFPHCGGKIGKDRKFEVLGDVKKMGNEWGKMGIPHSQWGNPPLPKTVGNSGEKDKGSVGDVRERRGN